MKNNEIKKYLDDVRLNYKETKSSFIIPKEKNMSDNKAPKWFSDWSTGFEERIITRIDNLESRIINVEKRIDKYHPE